MRGVRVTGNEMVKGVSEVWGKMPPFIQMGIVLFSLPMGLIVAKTAIEGDRGMRPDVEEIRKNSDTLVADMQYFKALAIKADAENAVQSSSISDIDRRVRVNETAINSLDRLHQLHQSQIDNLNIRLGVGIQPQGPQIGPMKQPNDVLGFIVDIGGAP